MIKGYAQTPLQSPMDVTQSSHPRMYSTWKLPCKLLMTAGYADGWPCQQVGQDTTLAVTACGMLQAR